MIYIAVILAACCWPALFWLGWVMYPWRAR